MKIAVIWCVAARSVIDMTDLSDELIATIIRVMEAGSFSDISVTICTQQNNLKDSHHHFCM
jgi:hypothetical protein